ncbi:predicted protein [Uncinocarpus reesii 1704]|uniref:DUF3752 domain-containing protein n=1 Tax=Uncinocarpus reesii (strain UAMH 1704) TaxID=336963 RepID=C4JI29_UNCRE|nr:uncharacterized protein UREG_01454 [Uncinocarpus reesii 1704]EEP76605.1 predicted protein [Uncinocarpus reesii 1704]
MPNSASDRPSPQGKRKLDEGGADEAQGKKARVIGPIMPPAHLVPQADSDNESSSGDSDDDDDDGYGPTLPPTNIDPDAHGGDTGICEQSESPVGPSAPPGAEPTKRDDWMLRPPEQLDLSSRVDPTKLRNRKFNTGRAANAPTGKSMASTWTETAEQKRKRLENEVMGIQAPASSGAPRPQVEDSSRAISMQEKARNKSLYAQHQTKAADVEKDDPSARPFDKEKDIRGPSKINHSQRRELLNKASSNISSRFSGGNFL